MPFNLFFASGGPDEYKHKHNTNQLWSQINDKSRLDDWVKYKKNNPESTSKIFVDSGAYSVWSRGKELDVDGYIDYIKQIDDQVFCYAQCDKIPGEFGRTPTDEEKARTPDESWENYLYMVERVPSPKKLIPIFHQFEPWSALERIVNYKYPDGSYVDYIGLSPSPQAKGVTKQSWIDFFAGCFEIIKKSQNPDVKTHAFGCTSLDILEMFPFYSADSAIAIISAGYGLIKYKGKDIGFSLRPNMRAQSEHFLRRSLAEQEEIRSAVKKVGFDVDYLLEHDDMDYRACVTMALLSDWAQNYKCKYEEVRKIPKRVSLW